jgi:hypothetical protein
MAPAPKNAVLTKWEGSAIRLGVELPYPVPPDHSDYPPYVELWVPDAWKEREKFIAETKLIKPPDFEHVSDHLEEVVTTSSIWKYIPYETCITGPESRFDGNLFIDSFRNATKALVNLEKDIDRILAGLVES